MIWFSLAAFEPLVCCAVRVALVVVVTDDELGLLPANEGASVD